MMGKFSRGATLPQQCVVENDKLSPCRAAMHPAFSALPRFPVPPRIRAIR